MKTVLATPMRAHVSHSCLNEAGVWILAFFKSRRLFFSTFLNQHQVEWAVKSTIDVCKKDRWHFLAVSATNRNWVMSRTCNKDPRLAELSMFLVYNLIGFTGRPNLKRRVSKNSRLPWSRLLTERKLPFSNGVLIGRASLPPFLPVIHDQHNELLFFSPGLLCLIIKKNLLKSGLINVSWLHPCSFIQPLFMRKMASDWSL